MACGIMWHFFCVTSVKSESHFACFFFLRETGHGKYGKPKSWVLRKLSNSTFLRYKNVQHPLDDVGGNPVRN